MVLGKREHRLPLISGPTGEINSEVAKQKPLEQDHNRDQETTDEQNFSPPGYSVVRVVTHCNLRGTNASRAKSGVHILASGRARPWNLWRGFRDATQFPQRR
jgi:hypothetical protein